MNESQRNSWASIRKCRPIFLAKYVAVFYTFLIAFVPLVVVYKGFPSLLVELSESTLADRLGIAVVLLGWAAVGYIHGTIAWKTWEQEFAGEAAFASRFSVDGQRTTGYTNNPFKEVFAAQTFLLALVVPSLIIIPFILGNAEYHIQSTVFSGSENYSTAFNLLVLIIAILAFVFVAIAGGTIGIFLWLIVLRPFYSAGEVIGFISPSKNGQACLVRFIAGLLTKVAAGIFKTK